MTEIDTIVEKMLAEGYLSPENVKAAGVLLAGHLSVKDQLDFEKLELDSISQEQIIQKDKPYAEMAAEAGDRKEMEVNREIIQDALDHEDLDLAEMDILKSGIARQAKKAAKAMVSSGLVSKQNQEPITQLILQMWVSE